MRSGKVLRSSDMLLTFERMILHSSVSAFYKKVLLFFSSNLHPRKLYMSSVLRLRYIILRRFFHISSCSGSTESYLLRHDSVANSSLNIYLMNF